jgi:hypothetical protein
MGIYNRLLRKVAHFQVEHPILTILFILALTIAIFGGVSQVKTVASLEQMMPKSIGEIEGINTLRDNYLGQDMIAVVLTLDKQSTDPNGVMDIRDKRVYDYILHLEAALKDQLDIREVYSLATIAQQQFNTTEITQEQYEQFLRNPASQTYLRSYLNDDYSTTLIIATTDVSANDPRMTLLAERMVHNIESIGRPPGVRLELTGTPIIQQKLADLINQDRVNTSWISTLLVLIITMIMFRSFTTAIVPIVVVTISVNWLYGTMGYAGLPISTLAGGVAAMVIGIGIDYAIHLMNKFKYERKKGMDVKQSVEAAVVDTGTALTATSVTTMAAFLAFLVGQMPEMGRFGKLMAIGVAYSLIFTILALPALLIIEEKILAWIKKRGHFGIEGEYHLVDEKECQSPKRGGKK